MNTVLNRRNRSRSRPERLNPFFSTMKCRHPVAGPFFSTFRRLCLLLPRSIAPAVCYVCCPRLRTGLPCTRAGMHRTLSNRIDPSFAPCCLLCCLLPATCFARCCLLCSLPLGSQHEPRCLFCSLLPRVLVAQARICCNASMRRRAWPTLCCHASASTVAFSLAGTLALRSWQNATTSPTH